MARRKEQDRLEQILILVNGKMPHKSKHIIAQQKELIEYLRTQPQGKASRKEVQEFLHLEFEKHAKETKEYRRLSKRFYTIVSPLINTLFYSDGNSYQLDYDNFKRFHEQIRRSADRYLHPEKKVKT